MRGPVRKIAREAGRAIGVWIVVGALAATCFGFATAAIFIWLESLYGPVQAATFVALGCGVLALIAFLAGTRPAPEQSDAAEPGTDPTEAMISAFLAGYSATSGRK